MRYLLSMKKSIGILLILPVLFIQNVFSQSDTFFVNGQGIMVQREAAQYYRLVSRADSSLFKFSDYYFSNRLKRIFHSASPQATILQGKCTEYDLTGTVLAEGEYHKGYKTGEWNYYFLNSERKREKQLYSSVNEFYTCRYDSVSQKIESEGAIDKYGKKTGIWKQYHSNSDSVKIISNYVVGKKEGEQLEYYRSGHIRRREIFLNNKLQKGELFDEKGKKMKYFPAFTYPQYREYISDYLQRSESCVAEALKKKDFHVAVVILKDGTVSDATVTGVENSECVSHIKTALMKMKKWKPAMWENNPVKYTYETDIRLYVPRE